MIILFLIISILCYFFPTFIARGCSHKNTLAIFVLNFLTGWTLLGWVLALVWACCKETAVVQPDPATVWDRTAIYGSAPAVERAPIAEKLAQLEPIFQDQQSPEKRNGR